MATIELNPADVSLAEKFFGLTADKVTEMDVLNNVHPDDKLEVAVAFALGAMQDEYVDNWRIHPVSMRDAHDAIAKKGCCGSSDWMFKSPVTGNKYILGYNYGH